MRRIYVILLLAILFLAVPASTSVQAAMLPRTAPVINGTLFWSNGCPHCETVLRYTLPPLQESYRNQLNIQMVELVTLEDVDEFYAIFTAFGLSKEQIDVPLLLINDIPMVGSGQIAAELPDLIDEYLAVGGIEPPLLPAGHEALLARAVPFTSFDPSILIQAEEDATFDGYWLGWAVMVILALAVLLAILALGRAFQGKPLATFKGWLDLAVPVLAIIGLGVALYLTYVETSQAMAICGPVGDCNTVQSSSYAKLFGFLPVGLLGALGFFAMLAAWGWQHWRSDRLVELAGPALFGMALFGTVFCIYLTYLELFVIHAVCIWCLSSAVIMALLLLLTLPPATQWLAVSDEDEE
jgi:uncharacterized membrane protein/glutaredoxin